jgi:hypothetical protein
MRSRWHVVETWLAHACPRNEWSELPMLMTAEDYCESLRRLKPRVFVNGAQIESVADEPLLAPGVNAMGVTYDFAHDERYRHLMTATEQSSGKLASNRYTSTPVHGGRMDTTNASTERCAATSSTKNGLRVSTRPKPSSTNGSDSTIIFDRTRHSTCAHQRLKL